MEVHRMELVDIRKKIVESFQEVGIFIDYTEEDVDLRNYFEDSLQFISSIVELEKVFCIEVPESILNFENMDSLNKVCMIIDETLASQVVN